MSDTRGMLVDPRTGTDTRDATPQLAGERETLIAFLRWQRQTFEIKCADLDAEGLACRSVAPSSMSLLGLIRHLADVERSWFRRAMSGSDAPPLFSSPDDLDGDFDSVRTDPAMVVQAWQAWRAEVANAEQFVEAAESLEVTGDHHRNGVVSLRWVLLHMIEEYARHVGHADLLRERLDGAIGE